MRTRTKRCFSVLLSLAMLVALLPLAALPAAATEINQNTTSWSGDMSVAGDVTIDSGVSLTAAATLTVAKGKTLTVNGTVDTGTYTLTVAGPGTLVVNSPEKDGDDNGAPGVSGKLTVTGGSVSIKGGSGFYGAGAPGIRGELTVSGGAVMVTGGTGEYGGCPGVEGNVFVYGGDVTFIGAAGGTGSGGAGVNGNVTLNGGSIRTTGGGGNSSNGSGGAGVSGSVTVSSGKATITGGQDGGAGVSGGVYVTGGDVEIAGGSSYYGGAGVNGDVTLSGGSIRTTGGSGLGGNGIGVNGDVILADGERFFDSENTYDGNGEANTGARAALNAGKTLQHITPVSEADDLHAALVSGGVVLLTADINLNGSATNKWEPIENFTGTFDGQGYTITGLYVDTGSCRAGLFGTLDNGSVVKDLSLENCSVKCSGNYDCGGIAGFNGGTIQNCHFSGTVSALQSAGGIAGYNDTTGTIQSCDNAGTISGLENHNNCQDIGGIVGENQGAVLKCINTGAISNASFIGGVVGYNRGSVEDSYNTGTVSGNIHNPLASGTDSFAGGVVGFNDSAVVTNCYNTGAVSGTGQSVGGVVGRNKNNGATVTNCYSIGAVSGKGSVGGVCGSNSDSTVTNCYFDKEATLTIDGTEVGDDAKRAVGNVEDTAAGKLSKAQFTDQASFTGFDFSNVWAMAGSRPVLKAFSAEVGSWSALYAALQHDGAVTLTENVTYNNTENADQDLIVPATAAVRLDLGGHTIDRAASETAPAGALRVEGGLLLTDSAGNGKLTGGHRATNDCGGGVYVYKGSFTLAGGAITGNYVDGGGGGVMVDKGSFTLAGGSIAGNTANVHGGGVYVLRGSFTMTGGSITGNTANNSGGGVDMHSGSSFTMTGGSITGNTANVDGGGVNMYSGSSFTMTGGSISDNTANDDGGGVYMYGGIFRVSGSPVVSENAKGTGETRTESNVRIIEPLVIDGDLGGDARIGVTMSDPGDITFGLSNKGTAASFFSDDPAWCVTATAAGEAALVKLPVVTYDADYADGPEVVQQTFPYNEAYTLRADVFARRGWTLAAWLDDADNSYAVDQDVTLTADLTLNAKWTPNGLEVADIPDQTADGTARTPALTVTDAVTKDVLTKGTDYTVEYYLNDSPVTELKAAGTYTVLVTGAGDYAEAEPVEKPFTLNAPENDSGNTGGWVPSPAPAAPAAQKATPSVTGEGSFTLSNDNPKAGETVTMSAAPAEGWRLLRFQVTDGEKNDVPVEMDDDVTGRYVQPKSDVAVRAAFVPVVPAAAAPSAVLSPQRITVNGAECTVEAYNIGGTNFFRLRDLAAMLSGTPAQFNVEYDSQRNAVVITRGAAYSGAVGVDFTDMSASAMKSPQAVFIDGAPIPLTAFNIGGYNFFGLRELAEFLGFTVNYDDATNTAVIESK